MKRALVIVSALISLGADEDMGRRVQELLRAHQADVFGCAPKATVESEILVRVMVGEDKKAARADVLKGGPPSLGQCVAEKIRTWDLSPLGAAPGDQIVFPLAFKPDDPKARVELADGAARDCADPMEQALVGLGRATVNGEKLGEGDVVWLPARATCRVDGRVLRVRARPTATATATATARAAEVKPLSIAGGKGSVKLMLDGKGASFAVDLMSVEAGAKVPPHVHDGSDEIIFVLQGRGTTTVGGAPLESRAGELLRIPAGVQHSLVVSEKMSVVQIYAPGGPEQRFKGAK
jgi:quercetin dioxygenase-like cupin family protein